MQATLDLPITLERLTPEEITWIAAKSAQTGKSTAEVIRDAFRKAAQSGIRSARAVEKKGGTK